MSTKTAIAELLQSVSLNSVELMSEILQPKADTLAAIKSLAKSKFIKMNSDKEYELTEQGEDWLAAQSKETPTPIAPKKVMTDVKPETAIKPKEIKIKKKRAAPGTGKMIKPNILTELVRDEIQHMREFMAQEYGIRNAPLNAVFSYAIKHASASILRAES